MAEIKYKYLEQLQESKSLNLFEQTLKKNIFYTSNVKSNKWNDPWESISMPTYWDISPDIC